MIGELLLLLVVLSGESPTADDASCVPSVRCSDMEALQGAWRLVAEIKDRRRIPFTNGGTISVTRRRWTVSDEIAFDFTLREDVEPKQIDWNPTNGEPAWQGIYRLEDDELFLCLGSPGTPRPTVFQHDAERGVLIHVRRREK